MKPFFFILLFFFFSSCSQNGLLDNKSPIPFLGTAKPYGINHMSPQNIYAGEVLSYMMRVVVGMEGRPGFKGAWQTRGIDARLNFDDVSALMVGPMNKRSSIMVLDTNIIGLSSVLFHYNKRFNLFKGAYAHQSFYPSVELVALRLFLVQKMNRGEKLNYKELVKRTHLFLDHESAATQKDLLSMGLNHEEFLLLRDVFNSDPMFSRYLKHPFVIKAFLDAGVSQKNKWTQEHSEGTFYKGFYPRNETGIDKNGRIFISIIPSMIKLFEPVPTNDPAFPYHFRPSEDYTNLSNRLKTAIVHAAASAMMKNNTGKLEEIDKIQMNRFKKRIVFIDLDKKPLVVYPANAGKVTSNICPEADLNIIILGKNVYRSMDINREKDVYPHTNRIYLDEMDVKYLQIDEEIEMIEKLVTASLLIDPG